MKDRIESMFIETTGPSRVHNALPFGREAIIAIVRHWSQEKYLELKWKNVDWGTFITGDIEEGHRFS